MLKKLLIILGLTIGSLSAYLYWDYSGKRTVITPYPYAFLNSFNKKYAETHANEIKEAEFSKILIVGDRMGRTLDPYLQNLQDQFKGQLKNPPTIFNWSAENESLFRTIQKLKNLKKLPPIIIYFGASSELTEKRFDVRDKKSIFKNFKTYDDEKLISLIITFPWMSKVLYDNIHYQDLGDYKEYKSFLAASQKLEEKEIAFKLFEYEMRQFIEMVKDKKSNLVLMTTPVNFEIEPREVCAHSTNTEIIGIQQEIEAELNEGSYKTALPKTKELISATPSNARSFYLLGKAALGSGDIRLARESLLKASVFDCANWRGNAVYNAIIKAEAKKGVAHVIDFEQYMTSHLSNEGLFIDEIIPQNIFYQSMTKELGDIIKKILSVNE
jgi:hypothetical protein